ncbi:MAG: hypothetical protein BWY32_02779 [bacterium ADurb.Bin243]|nr:MAG: hypothetical protein BWY32_02779 [bacterium ADurb.Bin243]HOD40724.1 histidine kinase N-terminal 7TM domain-containing protein [Candidatus Wallbacteria bacterium]
MHIKYFFSVLPLISCILVALLGSFVLAQNKGARTNRLFTSLCAALCFYNSGAFFMYIAEDPASAVLASKTCIFSTAFLTALLPHFVFAFVSENHCNQSSPLLKLLFFYGLFSLIAFLNYNSLIVSGVTLTLTGFASVRGPFFVLYAGALIVSGAYSMFHLYFSQSVQNAVDYRAKIRHIFLGVLVCFLFGFFDIFKKISGVLIEVSTFEYGIILFCALTAYAIVKHNFLHIEFAVKKGVLYSILMILVAITVLTVAVAAEQLTQSWLNSSSFAVNLLNALIVGIFFDPVKDRLQRILNKYFFPRVANIDIDDELIGNKAILDYIAGEKIDELKSLKSKIERVISDYEKSR